MAAAVLSAATVPVSPADEWCHAMSCIAFLLDSGRWSKHNPNLRDFSPREIPPSPVTMN
jgi:hypothetical protein